jgi:hypothetical protein
MPGEELAHLLDYPGDAVNVFGTMACLRFVAAYPLND